MLYAINMFGEKILPSPNQNAICPCCNGKVISKCGKIIAWHWAHAVGSDCDDQYEADDNWSIEWKKRFSIEKCEMVINGRRADFKTDNDEVIRLQKRTLSPAEIRDIENHFGDMIWIFKVDDAIHNLDFRRKDNYFTFRWKHPKKTIAYTSRPTFLDVGDDMLFILKKMYQGTPYGGWGYFITIEKFLKINKFNISKFSKIEDYRIKWGNQDSEEEQFFVLNTDSHHSP